MANFVKPPSHFREELQKKGGGSMLNQNQHMSGCSRQFPGVCRSRRNAGESGAKRDGRGRQDRQDKWGKRGRREAAPNGTGESFGRVFRRRRRACLCLSGKTVGRGLPCRIWRWGNLFEPRIRCHRCLDVDADLTEIFSVLLKLDIDY